MHQPYYKNLLTQETDLPWVRLHASKDYVDMVAMLEKFPAIHQTFNVVPSLLEQIEDYSKQLVKDKFMELTLKEATKLTQGEKDFLLNNFFMINPDKVISYSPRYYELYFKKQGREEFTTADYLDLQVWFNLSWIDPYFRNSIPELKQLVSKGRFFDEADKRIVLDKQLYILEQTIPVYNKFIANHQLEVTVSPYYHPILPLLYNTNIAREANNKTVLPKIGFSFPQDAKKQIDDAVSFFKERFGNNTLSGMWPSEEAVSEHILPFLIEAGINWIVADEAVLFKSLKKRKRDTRLLYEPHLLKREEGSLNIVFRDRNLSDLIGFNYCKWSALNAVDDFMKHLNNISTAFKDKDILVTIAMDGENAWEYYPNDGHDFLELLYKRLSEAEFLKTTTISEYLKTHPAENKIKRISAGSWIYGEFGKWIGNPHKVKAWEYLAIARKELEDLLNSDKRSTLGDKQDLAWKQIYILEGSDWFWWYGEDYPGYFDRLFRMHLTNFYTLINKEIPAYLDNPI
ncbi:MAG: glycoside hydrolase family 57 protein [Candidatus Omnitrophica bacterium]|jgi:alpha-amylase/alpha-mannosidase (GH57 family)|nr:glycoside hydrolase family 57 protein [Candidatus Omnitrophota bacterium]